MLDDSFLQNISDGLSEKQWLVLIRPLTDYSYARLALTNSRGSSDRSHAGSFSQVG